MVRFDPCGSGGPPAWSGCCRRSPRGHCGCSAGSRARTREMDAEVAKEMPVLELDQAGGEASGDAVGRGETPLPIPCDGGPKQCAVAVEEDRGAGGAEQRFHRSPRAHATSSRDEYGEGPPLARRDNRGASGIVIASSPTTRTALLLSERTLTSTAHSEPPSCTTKSTRLSGFRLALLEGSPRFSHLRRGDPLPCLGGNQYQITLNLFRDCVGIDMGSPRRSCSIPPAGVSTLGGHDGLTEVSQLCPGRSWNSTCNFGALPGMEMYTYTGVVTLPPCDLWTMSWFNCCRNDAILNLVAPA